MMRLGPRFALLVAPMAALALAAQGCSPGGAKGPGGNHNNAPDDLSTLPEGEDMAESPDLAIPCGALECMQVECGEVNPPTTLIGTVFAPDGKLPVYNAIVYVPTTRPEPFKAGLTCDRCDGHVTGKPLVLTQSGSDGKFELTNVPAGDNIPLVIQIGKWRRQVLIPHVPACEITKLDSEHSRLAKNRSEGDLPQLAIATGSVDPMECLLLKMGIDPKEFRNPGQGGRVEMFLGAHSPGTRIDGSTPKADDPLKGLYYSPSQLQFYDIVILPCEGSEYDQGAIGRKNIVDYVNKGGRVFTTHYSYDWLTYQESPFNKIQTPLTNGLWHTGGAGATISAELLSDFPKGKAFVKWLKAAGAQSPLGTLTINDIRYDIDEVDKMFAQPWATTMYNNRKVTPHLTFNTPLDATKDDAGVRQYCGRVVFSDFHVAAAEANIANPFPGACKGGAMTDQEMALAFMIFDLSSCVQPDNEIPIP